MDESAGQVYPIGPRPLTIGRAPECDVVARGEAVSRSHAHLIPTPQGYLLVDTSAHGTYVNGERVRAQRLLSEADRLEVGERRFRLDLGWSDAIPERRSSAALPATSENACHRPRRAGLSGKAELVRAFSGPRPLKARLTDWLRRYGMVEAVSVALAMAGSWLVYGITDSEVAAAYAASEGETVGFYGTMVLRDLVYNAYAAGARRDPYGTGEVVGTCRALLLRFGPAELLDSLIVRPLAIGLATALLGRGLGVLAGKLAADAAFYALIIGVCERNRRAP